MNQDVRRLGGRERTKYADHLKALNPADRRMRFGLPVSDEAIDRMVAGIAEDDEILGVFDGDDLLGAVHVARDPSGAELGLSVADGFRHQGLGRRLFEAGVEAVRQQGLGRITLYCLTTNAAIMRLVRAAGMTVNIDCGEATAWIGV